MRSFFLAVAVAISGMINLAVAAQVVELLQPEG